MKSDNEAVACDEKDCEYYDEEEYSFHCAEGQEAHFSLTYAQELRQMARI